MTSAIRGLAAFFFTLIFTAASAHAGDATKKITLEVLEKGSGRPLEHAEVAWKSSNWFTEANGKVSFEISDDEKGTVFVRLSGFETEKLKASELSADATKSIYLFPSIEDVAEENTVVVTGQKNKTSGTGIGGAEGDELAGSGDAASNVFNFAGVSSGEVRKTPPGPGGRNGPRPQIAGNRPRQGGGPGGRGPGGGGRPGGGGPGGRGPGDGGRPGGDGSGGRGPGDGGRPGGRPGGGGGPSPDGAPPSGDVAGGGAAGPAGANGPGGGGGGPAGLAGGGSLALQGATDVPSGAANGPIVRGSTPDDSLFLVDDIQVPYLFHGVADLAIVPTMMTERVELSSGGFGARYGGSTGGVLRLLTPSALPEKPTTNFTLNAPYYSGISHTRPIDDSSAMTVAVRRSYYDGFVKTQQERREKKDPLDTSAIETARFTDAQAQYLHKDEDGSSKVTAIYSDDAGYTRFSDNYVAPTTTTTTSYRDRLGVIGYERRTKINDRILASSTPQASVLTETLEDGAESQSRHFRGRIPTELRYLLGKGDGVSLGLDPSAQYYKVTSGESSRAIHTQGVASWLAADVTMGKFTLMPGYRVEYRQDIKHSANDPRFSARYALAPSVDLKLAVGRYSKAPSLTEADKELGRPDLLFERVTHYGLGVEKRFGEDWVVELEGFYKDGREMITADADRRYDNDGQMISGGGEVTIRKNPTGRTFGWLTYTRSRTVTRESPTTNFSRASYDQTHVGSLVLGYRLTAVWRLESSYSYHSGAPYSPSSGGSVYSAATDSYTASAAAAASRDLPKGQQASASVSHDILFDTWRMTVRGGVGSYWSEGEVESLSSSYNGDQDVAKRSQSTIPFIEIGGTI